MASLISDTEPPSHPHPISSRTKKRRLSVSSSATNVDGDIHARWWRSEKQHRNYSAKLVHALRHVRLLTSSSSKRGKAVREAADSALAVSARGRTLWSRAILANRIKLKFRKQTGGRRSGRRWKKKQRRVTVVKLSKKSVPTVNRKVRVLGRLVPGCRKESVPVILEEATDYIQALEMQVRAMKSLAELLSGSGSNSATPPPPPPS